MPSTTLGHILEARHDDGEGYPATSPRNETMISRLSTNNGRSQQTLQHAACCRRGFSRGFQLKDVERMTIRGKQPLAGDVKCAQCGVLPSCRRTYQRRLGQILVG